jgi:predicted ATPase/DNA-binding SARP family transcriptional activator
VTAERRRGDDGKQGRDRAALRVLGPVVVERAGSCVALAGAKARQLLAVLASAAGRPVSSDLLIETLWAGEPPPSAVASLQSHVSRLRGALAPEIAIVRAANGYLLDAGAAMVDGVRFEEMLRRSAEFPPAEAAQVLNRALGLWRGPAFGDDADLDAIRPEAVRLDELRLVATERWADARLHCGDAAALVGELDALVERHPLRERFWVLLMLALHRTGRQAEALRRAQQLRRLLAEEAGLDLPAGVRELERRILADEPALVLPAAPVIHQAVASRPAPADGSGDDAGRRSGASASHALRSSGTSGATAALLGSTSFVGREPEVAELVEALQRHALVTVSGPGGVGKTRLALRAAARLADAGRPVSVVQLATVRDPAGVGQVVAHGLDIQPRQHRTLDETIVEYLASRHDLLVLDNCEHLAGTVGPLVDRLRNSCPELGILATSRQPLGLAGEFVSVVAPLALPEPGRTALGDVARSPAVQLFVARAAAAVPDFALDEETCGAVAEICRRLEGLPLGLELAAARVRALGVDALAERLAYRVQSLGQLQRGDDGRQRTLADLVRWSYDLLEPRARAVFAQLGVFAGGFDLDAVDAVCGPGTGSAVAGPPLASPAGPHRANVRTAELGDIVDVLADLVDQSMVVLVDRRIPRYRLLEPLREFALDRLTDDGRLLDVEARHVDWFVELAERGAAGLDTPDEAAWAVRLDRNFDNFRTAMRSAARAGDADRAVRLVVALHERGIRAVQYEVMAWADLAASLPGARQHPAYPTVVGLSAYGEWVRGHLERSIELARAALAARGDGPAGDALAERVLANAHFYLGDDEGRDWIDRLLSAAREANASARVAHALYMASIAATSLGNSERGVALAGEAAAPAAIAGSRTALAQARYALGLALEGTDLDAALDHLEHAARLAGSAGNRWVEAFALTEVHWLRARRGEPLAALAGFRDVVSTWYRGGDWANQWLSLRRVLGVLVDAGALEAAAVLHGALEAAGVAHALPFEPADARRLVDLVDELRSLLGEGAFADAMGRGASLTESGIVEYVIERIDQLTPPDAG